MDSNFLIYEKINVKRTYIDRSSRKLTLHYNLYGFMLYMFCVDGLSSRVIAHNDYQL